MTCTIYLQKLVLFSGILVTSFACNHPTEEKGETSWLTEGVIRPEFFEDLTKHTKKLDKRELKERRNTDYLNNVRTIQLYDYVKNLCWEHRHATSLDSSFSIPDSISEGFADTYIRLRLGTFFSGSPKQFVVTFNNQGNVHSIIYSVQQNQLKRELFHEKHMFAYRYDTLGDFNGDGYMDYAVHWYPTAGCCLANAYDLFLGTASGLKNSYVNLINPSFYPKEHRVRGLDYGHPGETAVYEYRWIGTRLDTVEYILPLKVGDTVRFLKSKHHPYWSVSEDSDTINKLPAKYLSLPEIGWFGIEL